jgi:hypothetical protein
VPPIHRRLPAQQPSHPGCHSTSGSSPSSSASTSRPLAASTARLKASTFSCDIAYSWSSAAMRAAALSGKAPIGRSGLGETSRSAPSVCRTKLRCPAPASFVNDDDNARPRIYQLFRIEAVVLPGAPVVTRRLDDRIAANVHAVQIRRGRVAQVPGDVLVKQRPEGLDVSNSASNQLHVLLRRRLGSISRRVLLSMRSGTSRLH